MLVAVSGEIRSDEVPACVNISSDDDCSCGGRQTVEMDLGCVAVNR